MSLLSASHNISKKNPAVVDSLFAELGPLRIHPGQLEFTSDLPTNRMLGGGYGDVRRATLHPAFEPLQADGTRFCWEDGHITVAVKRLKDLDRIDLQRRKRMVVREIHLLSKVLHPNIARFRGFHVEFDDSIAWLISDWEAFGNVLDYLRDHDVGVIEQLQLLHDTAKALAYLHSLDPLICHGDIKAANVLVGQDHRAMLCDFGLARIIEDEGFEHLETSADFRGSIPWCSPELLDGQRSSPESDIWAFGCLVWEVATRTTPFSDLPSKLAIMSAIIRRKLPQPQQLPFFQQIPRLSKFLKDCWHKDPAARPSARDSSLIIAHIIDNQKNKGLEGSWFFRAVSRVSGVRGPLDLSASRGTSEVLAVASPASTGDSTNDNWSHVVSDQGVHSTALHYRPKDEGDISEETGAAVRDDSPGDITALVQKTNNKPTKFGSMSAIFEGILEPNNQKVAIKRFDFVILDSWDSNSREARYRLDTRLQLEMQVWRPLKSPRVVPCLGYATMDNMPCLISPWYANGNLRDHTRANPGFDRKASIMQVAEGLAYIHSHNVAHYDLKPTNIIIDDTGKAMLSDIGVARILEKTRTGLTSSNSIVMSIFWSSPEALEDGACTLKSDVYSFACVALEIMTGKVPYYYLKKLSKLIPAKLEGTLLDFSQFPELPQADPLWSVLMKCWALTPAQRPTMVQVISKLSSLGFHS